MGAAPDYEAHELLILYRDKIRELLAEHAMTSPRIVGFAGMKRHLPAGALVEMLVDVAGVHDWYAVDAHRVADRIGDLLGYPVSLTHCPVGSERLVESEQMWRL